MIPLAPALSAIEAALRLAAGPSDPEAQRIREQARALRSGSRLTRRDMERVVALGRRYRSAVAHALTLREGSRRRVRKEGIAYGALLGILRTGVDEEDLVRVGEQLGRDLRRPA